MTDQGQGPQRDPRWAEDDDEDDLDEAAAPFDSSRMNYADATLMRDDETREALAVVFDLIAAGWGSSRIPFSGCELLESGVAVTDLMRMTCTIQRRGAIGGSEAAWLKDRLAFAAAEIDGDADPELCALRARRSALEAGDTHSTEGTPVRSIARFEETHAIRRLEAKRFLELKGAVLLRCGQRSLARLLAEDPTAYETLVDAGERFVTRLMAAVA